MNRRDLLLCRHVANECGGWVKIVKRFRAVSLNIERVTV